MEKFIIIFGTLKMPPIDKEEVANTVNSKKKKKKKRKKKKKKKKSGP